MADPFSLIMYHNSVKKFCNPTIFEGGGRSGGVGVTLRPVEG